MLCSSVVRLKRMGNWIEIVISLLKFEIPNLKKKIEILNLKFCHGLIKERLLSSVPFACTKCTMASPNSSSSSSVKDRKSEATRKREHYGNYLSQLNTKIPKTTFYRVLNKSKMLSEENLTCARENLLPASKDPEANVFDEPLQNELNCSKHAQLSSFVNDNPEILDASGIPSCSRRSSHFESEVPTSLGSSEFQQPNGGNEGLYVKETNTTLRRAKF